MSSSPSSSFLQRSRTAPQSLNNSLATPYPLPRSLSQDYILPKKATTSNAELEQAASTTRLWAERRNNGLSLDESTDSWAGPSDAEWDYLKEHAPKLDIVDEDTVEETIQQEDKLGVLSQSVAAILGYAREQLFSPYTAESAVDEDSLYLHLRSERTKHQSTEEHDKEFGLRDGQYANLFLVN
ncbi:hypothetical protein CYLTODRAFT_419253 [Cylindrobasidium torrendii FP15055 ss-10]|uniref:Uncharacterized protein n=1 Tax=Cylindrobasidium torrendii FP15055 ss-10 TaxID=1314674 RepID=A0A0D7BKH8_9AGAR|nr:hypothetical protein CYLTODRAFT_419253 [Cylindrobasidium torrendii FP15055 ss-10]